MRLVIIFDMFLNPSFKMTTSFVRFNVLNVIMKRVPVVTNFKRPIYQTFN